MEDVADPSEGWYCYGGGVTKAPDRLVEGQSFRAAHVSEAEVPRNFTIFDICIGPYMRTATTHTVGALVVAWMFATGTARADTVEMFGCGFLGRMATIEPTGRVIQRQTPVDMARDYMEHCDFVALGRFTSITVEDYASKIPRDVVALFVVDETLLGVERASVKVRVSEGMLVQAGETVNRHTARNVYEHNQLLATGLYGVVVEDLHDLKQGKAAPTDLLPGLERNIERLYWGRSEPIDRATELRLAHSMSFVSHGTTFYLEGGAIHPDTQFLLGLDAVATYQRHGQLTEDDTLLHWGDYAAEVAGAIRAAAE